MHGEFYKKNKMRTSWAYSAKSKTDYSKTDFSKQQTKPRKEDSGHLGPIVCLPCQFRMGQGYYLSQDEPSVTMKNKIMLRPSRR